MCGTWRPLGRRRSTYGEKTCCLTSAEGFELSAPIVVLAEVKDALRDDAGRAEAGALAAWPKKAR